MVFQHFGLPNTCFCVIFFYIITTMQRSKKTCLIIFGHLIGKKCVITTQLYSSFNNKLKKHKTAGPQFVLQLSLECGNTCSHANSTEGKFSCISPLNIVVFIIAFILFYLITRKFILAFLSQQQALSCLQPYRRDSLRSSPD